MIGSAIGQTLRIRVTATKNDEASQVKKLEEEVQALRKKLEQQATSGEGAAMTSKDRAANLRVRDECRQVVAPGQGTPCFQHVCVDQ